jgi:formylglycine-generating enzyme required for sulfatase activity
MLGLTSPLPPRTYFARSRFEMGSTADEKTRAFTDCVLEIYGHTCQGSDFDDEGPVRHVELSPFWLDRHEVTVAEYERCVGAHRCVAVPYFKGGERFRRAHLPVSLVTWHEARDYCAFAGGRLPTEAEWERAARGRHSRRYPWGNAYNPRVSNHGRLAFDSSDAVDGFAELAPVGAFPDGATPERVFDLAGNVEEWTWDRYADEYDADDTSDPRGPPVTSGEVERSVRGGSFTSPQVHLRTAARAFALPTERDITRGFRCARSATR